jgi:hypothetical protein
LYFDSQGMFLIRKKGFIQACLLKRSNNKQLAIEDGRRKSLS